MAGVSTSYLAGRAMTDTRFPLTGSRCLDRTCFGLYVSCPWGAVHSLWPPTAGGLKPGYREPGAIHESRRALFLRPGGRSLKLTRCRPFRQLRTASLRTPRFPLYRSLSRIQIIIFIAILPGPTERIFVIE